MYARSRAHVSHCTMYGYLILRSPHTHTQSLHTMPSHRENSAQSADALGQFSDNVDNDDMTRCTEMHAIVMPKAPHTKAFDARNVAAIRPAHPLRHHRNSFRGTKLM